MADTAPAATERLHRYWVHGDGAAKIRWGQPGDFDRCVLHLGKFIRDPQGYCNLAHHAALGIYPAQHAAEIKHATGRAAMATTTEPAGASRAELLPVPFVRSFPLQDISIRAGGDGRTVDAYATVFDTPAPIHDQDGDYIEVIDPRAFDRILEQIKPRSDGKAWRCGVFYNHGMTLHGTPSGDGSYPVGVALEIRADGHGLFTRTRYSKGPEVDRILEGINEGSISGYSFSGAFRRSAPLAPRGGFRPDKHGNLPTVRRTESTLREYGPTPFPAYEDALITAVRAEQLIKQLEHITERLRNGASLDEDLPSLSGAPDRDLPPGDLPDGRSVRSVKEDMQAARSAFLQRHRR